MPWLVKDEKNKDNSLLLIHVPRCGGTSLIKHFEVEKKSRKGRDIYHKIGLIYFFYRYRLLEVRNFPIKSFENLYALTVLIIATVIYFADPSWSIAACSGSRWCPPPISITFWVMGTFTFIFSTFIMVAAIMARNDNVRRFTMFCFGKLLCGFGSTKDYLHGVSYDGYLMHYTAEKAVKHHFIVKEDLDHSFAIIRNPYSRMVSLFGYNRLGPLESFDHFVKKWYEKYQVYKQRQSTEECDVYCHVLPMHEFTHHNGEQYVPNIIKQEDLKYISKPDKYPSKVVERRYSSLPNKIRQALIDMPHSNRRKPDKKWYDMYTQELMDLVLEMYKDDFLQYSYDTAIPNRPDLVPKMELGEIGTETTINPLFTIDPYVSDSSSCSESEGSPEQLRIDIQKDNSGGGSQLNSPSSARSLNSSVSTDSECASNSSRSNSIDSVTEQELCGSESSEQGDLQVACDSSSENGEHDKIQIV